MQWYMIEGAHHKQNIRLDMLVNKIEQSEPKLANTSQMIIDVINSLITEPILS